MRQIRPQASTGPLPPRGFPAHQDEVPLQVASVLVQDIARRAYDKFLARGQAHGFDQQDWTDANRELLAEAFIRVRPGATQDES